jgi:iron complex outermembrane recepter protein
MWRPLVAALASFGLLAVSGFQAAEAQTVASETAAPQSTELEEVIVTAQFRQQDLQQTPIAITAISADVARAQGATSLVNLGTTAPNVTFAPGSGIYPGAQMFIRGVGQTDFLPAEDPGVGVYLDDVYYGNIWGADFDLVDLDRVEISRGPQGTLSGVNSIGGSVKMYTQRAMGDGSGYFEAGYGTDDTTEVRGAFDVSLIPNTLYLRVSGALHRDDGYVTREDFACLNPAEAGTIQKTSTEAGTCAIGQEGGSNKSVARADLRWLATDKLEINLIADVDDVTSQPGAEVLTGINPGSVDPIWTAKVVGMYGVPFDTRFVTGGQYSTYTTYCDTLKHYCIDPNGFTNNNGYEGIIDYKITDDISLKSITSYREMTGYTSDGSLGTPLPTSLSTYTLNHKQFTEELRLSGTSFNKFLDWTAGVYYYDANDTVGGEVGGEDQLAAVGGLYFQVHDTVTSLKKAGYADLTFHLTDKLSLIGGARYNRTGTLYTFGRINPDNPYDTPNPLFGFPFFLQNLDGPAPQSVNARWDYRAALDYQWTPNFMTYAQVATGFKDGGINPTPLDVAQELPFRPETLTSYEIGVKSEFFDHHVTFDAAGFYSKYKNLQLTVLTTIDGLTANIFSNAGEATISGAEAEIQARPIGQLLFSASGSYLDFKYNNLGAAGLIANGPCLSCTQVLTPEYKASLAVQYDFNLSQWGHLTPRFSDDYTAKMYTDLPNTEATIIPQRWVANARLVWQLPSARWEAALEVTNVFDKYYYSNILNFWYAGGGAAMGLPGRPREALVTLRHSFGT